MVKPDKAFIKQFNSKENKELLKDISLSYDIDTSSLEKYNFYMNKKNKIHVSTIDLSRESLQRVNALGIYIGSMLDSGKFRPSLEGIRLINPRTNVITISEKILASFLAGENLFKDEIESINENNNTPFLGVKFKEDFIGIVGVQEREYTNYLSKSRKMDFNKVF